jgi:putative flippase GtrA
LGAFPRYLISAGTATCVDVALVQLLLSAGFANSPTQYATAIALGAVGGTAINFLLSRQFVFALDDRATHAQLSSFFVISLSTLLLRLLVAFALVGLFSLSVLDWIGSLPVEAPQERIAHLGAVGVVVIYSFLAHKHISFGGGVLAFLANKVALRP